MACLALFSLRAWANDPIADVRASILPGVQTTLLPDFSVYQDVRTKKKEFFHYLLPMIRHSNDQIRSDRSLLLALRDDLRTGTTVDSSAYDHLGEIGHRYGVPDSTDRLARLNALLLRVDVVPESLVLAQAAKESGWGTSRFAREGNNLFGVWCFTPGCGLKPLSRDAGLNHEVARYDSVQQSVNAYVHNINTHAAYNELRRIRAESRAGASIISGMALAEGLLRYSARGVDYVREIQQLIRTNNLQQFNLPRRV